MTKLRTETLRAVTVERDRLRGLIAEIARHFVWAVGMADEAITLRKASEDPEDKKMLASHEATLAEVRAAIAKVSAETP